MIEQRKFREAIPLLTRSEKIFLAQRGDTHDDFAFIFSNLALARGGLETMQRRKHFSDAP